MNQLSVQTRLGALSAFQGMLRNTERPELAALSEAADDTIITRDEFVMAMRHTTGTKNAGQHFDVIFNSSDLFRNHGETGETTVIEPEEIINLWESVAGMGDTLWTTASEESAVTVAGNTVGTLATHRRSVPKGWKLKGLPLDDSGAWKPVHFLEAKITLDKTKFSITADELSGLILLVGDYQKILTRVNFSETLEPDVHLNEFSLGPLMPPQCEVIRMPNAVTSGMSTYLNWSTHINGIDLNTSCPKEYGKIDTWGTWTITDKGGTIEIIYNAIVDKRDFASGADYSVGLLALAINKAANKAIDEDIRKLIDDLLRCANAMIVTKKEMTQKNGGTPPSFEDLKRTLLATYNKNAG